MKIHEKNSLKGHNNLTKLNARQVAYVYKVFMINHHMTFLRIIVHKHQGEKQGIKHMQANHRKHVEQVEHTDSF